MSQEIDDIISEIPDTQMAEGYVKQRAALQEQMALNAAAYRLMQAQDDSSDKEITLRQIGNALKAIRNQLLEIDRRLSGASEMLKNPEQTK